MHINAGYSRLVFLVIFLLVVVILWQPAVAQSVSLPECTVDIEDNDDDGSLDNDGADGTIDIDKDGDGLIELCDLEGIDRVRYQLDGSGYTTSTDATRLTQGCPDNGCIGYELVRSLDFASAASYGSGTTNTAWTAGAGWQPIGSNTDLFSGIFEGNGFTISGLYINRLAQDLIGLFAVLGSGSEIKNVGLLDINVQGDDNVDGLVASLVGENNGSITNSYASGTVTGDIHIGGLVGRNNGSIINSYASVAVTATNIIIGGLVGVNNGPIINSYATGKVSGSSGDIGGLVGRNGSTIINSYATNAVSGIYDVGGLVGWNVGSIINSYATSVVRGEGVSVGGLAGSNGSTIINSYATGMVTGNSSIGGLVGTNYSGSIRNSYAISRVMPLTDGSSQVGGLVGNGSGSITASYWDKTVNAGLTTSIGAKTTAELLTPTAPGVTSANTYYGWSTAAWDFGDRIHYPILYYATTDSITVSACAANPAPSSALPRCGSRIPNQAVRNLISVLEVSEVTTSSQPMANNDGTINEGSNVNLMVNATAGSGVYNFAWSQTSGRTLELEGSTSATLSFTIPIDFVELDATTAAIAFQVEVSDGFTTATLSKVVTIVKIDNGTPAIDFVETTKTLIAIVGPDPDGEGSITYHWEQRNLPEENWITITSAITATYQLPKVPNGSTLYRVNVSHTDGQGYVTTATGGPFRPSAVAGLIALDISTSAILVPKFAADIFTYVLKVAVDANTVSLTPFASTGSIVYSVNGGAEQAVARGQPFTVTLTEESQTLTITVELQDGSSKSEVYTISNIERVIFTDIRLLLEGLLP